MLLYFKNIIYEQRMYGCLQEVTVKGMSKIVFFKADSQGVVTCL